MAAEASGEGLYIFMIIIIGFSNLIGYISVASSFYRYPHGTDLETVALP